MRETRCIYIITYIIATIAFWEIDRSLPVAAVTHIILNGLFYIVITLVWIMKNMWMVAYRPHRNRLLAIGVLIELWVIIRMVGYIEVSNADLQTYLWYLGSIPMTFIPQMMLEIAYLSGKSEKEKVAKGIRYLGAIPILIGFLIITNNFHQMIYRFIRKPWIEINAQNTTGYYIIMLYITGCIVVATIILTVKYLPSRGLKNTFLPMVPVSFGIVYAILYLRGIIIEFFIFNDWMATLCILELITLETMLISGMIPSNIRYIKMFRSGKLGLRLTDKKLNIIASSNNAFEISKEQLQKAAKGTLQLEDGQSVEHFTMPHGDVFWTENVSQISSVLKELTVVRGELEDYNEVLKAEYEQVEKTARVHEQNQLYDDFRKQTKNTVERIASNLDLLANATTAQEIKDCLQKVIVLGAYYKRQGNLVLLSRESEYIDISEVESSFAESARALELNDITAVVVLRGRGHIRREKAIGIYEIFEGIIERGYFGITTLYTVITKNKDDIKLTINIEGTDECIKKIQEFNPDIKTNKDDDGIWYLSTSI